MIGREFKKIKIKKNDFNFTECLWNRSIMRVYVSVCVCVVKKATKILFGWFIIDGHYWRHHFNVCVCVLSLVSRTHWCVCFGRLQSLSKLKLLAHSYSHSICDFELNINICWVFELFNGGKI